MTADAPKIMGSSLLFSFELVRFTRAANCTSSLWYCILSFRPCLPP